jgi:hypothetical protein
VSEGRFGCCEKESALDRENGTCRRFVLLKNGLHSHGNETHFGRGGRCTLNGKTNAVADYLFQLRVAFSRLIPLEN